MINLPFAMSPVVIGLAVYVLYSRTGWFGTYLFEHGISVLFTWKAIAIATIFVSLPFVVREVVPVLEELGTEQEQAAEVLGASAHPGLLPGHPPGDPVGGHLRHDPHRRPRAR